MCKTINSLLNRNFVDDGDYAENFLTECRHLKSLKNCQYHDITRLGQLRVGL